MKSKIIIHNETDLPDKEVLDYCRRAVDQIPEYEYFEFNDGHKIQGFIRKSGKTIYFYGGKNAELIEESNSKIN